MYMNKMWAGKCWCFFYYQRINRYWVFKKVLNDRPFNVLLVLTLLPG